MSILLVKRLSFVVLPARNLRFSHEDLVMKAIILNEGLAIPKKARFFLGISITAKKGIHEKNPTKTNQSGSGTFA